jgi:serine/threonine protein kinase
MAVETAKQFLQTLQASNLLEPGQLDDARRLASPEQTPRSLARQLVQLGWITRWQAQQLLAGRTKFFLGKYKLLEGLGHGGMGAVFKAEHPGLSRVVALKVMTRALLQKPTAVPRFLREIRLAATLDDPHIVAAYDADCVGNTYFLVMEYVAGDTLKTWIKQHGCLPVDWSCEVIRQAALGLEHARRHGLVHRDIKPANLLIVRSAKDRRAPHAPRVKILDFGLARFASESSDEGGLTRTGQIMGTPDYMAPEQVRSSRDADIRADIYSLGCTLYHMLTGRVLFDNERMVDRLMARVAREAPRVRSYRPEVGPVLDDVVAKMLARQPEDRYQTPAEAAEALAPFAWRMGGAAASQALLLDVTPPPLAQVDAEEDQSLNQFVHELDNHAAAAPASEPPRFITDEPLHLPRRARVQDRQRARRRRELLALLIFLGSLGGLALAAILMYVLG